MCLRHKIRVENNLLLVIPCRMARDPAFKLLATHIISLTGFKNIFN